MIMLIAAIIALVLVVLDYIRPSNTTPIAVATLAVGHIIEYLA